MQHVRSINSSDPEGLLAILEKSGAITHGDLKLFQYRAIERSPDNMVFIAEDIIETFELKSLIRNKSVNRIAFVDGAHILACEIVGILKRQFKRDFGLILYDWDAEKGDKVLVMNNIVDTGEILGDRVRRIRDTGAEVVKIINFATLHRDIELGGIDPSIMANIITLQNVDSFYPVPQHRP